MGLPMEYDRVPALMPWPSASARFGALLLVCVSRRRRVMIVPPAAATEWIASAAPGCSSLLTDATASPAAAAAATAASALLPSPDGVNGPDEDTCAAWDDGNAVFLAIATFSAISAAL